MPSDEFLGTAHAPRRWWPGWLGLVEAPSLSCRCRNPAQDGSRPVQDPVGLAALQDEAAELPAQPGGRERRLAVPGMDVEHAALRARGRRGVRFVDRDRDAVNVQHAGQRETAEARPDDRDRSSCCSPRVDYWIVTPIG